MAPPPKPRPVLPKLILRPQHPSPSAASRPPLTETSTPRQCHRQNQLEFWRESLPPRSNHISSPGSVSLVPETSDPRYHVKRRFFTDAVR